MTLTITPVSPHVPDVARLLADSHALMAQMFAPDENHVLDPDALAQPGVTLFAAQADGAVLGCVALKRCAGYGEVKSLFVAAEARGLGIADRLMAHLETIAAQEGILLLRLETGDTLLAALRLYEARGFARCGPFGGYPDLGASVFLEKRLG